MRLARTSVTLSAAAAKAIAGRLRVTKLPSGTFGTLAATASFDTSTVASRRAAAVGALWALPDDHRGRDRAHAGVRRAAPSRPGPPAHAR